MLYLRSAKADRDSSLQYRHETIMVEYYCFHMAPLLLGKTQIPFFILEKQKQKKSKI